MGGSAGYQMPRIHHVINEVYGNAKKLLEHGNEVNLNPYLLMGTYAISYMTAKAAIETTIAKLEAEGKDYQTQYVRGKGYKISTRHDPSDENLRPKPIEEPNPLPAGQQFQCTKCTAHFPSEESMIKHVQSYHGE